MSAGCFFTADWDAPPSVKTLITTRQGGVSEGVFASLNLGLHVGDRPQHVLYNRALVQQAVPVPMAYLNQTHSTDVVRAADSIAQPRNADASWDDTGKAACTVIATVQAAFTFTPPVCRLTRTCALQ